MPNIKVSEVSDVLKMQLEGIDTKVKFEEVGRVLQVSDGVVRIFGLSNAESGELLEFENGERAVVMNLEEDNVGAVLLGTTANIKDESSTRWDSPSTDEALSTANCSRCPWNAKLRA